MRITINQEKCVTAGLCVTEADTVFDQDPETGLVLLLIDSPDPEHEEVAREAARLCPALPITIHEDQA